MSMFQVMNRKRDRDHDDDDDFDEDRYTKARWPTIKASALANWDPRNRDQALLTTQTMATSNISSSQACPTGPSTRHLHLDCSRTFVP